MIASSDFWDLSGRTCHSFGSEPDLTGYQTNRGVEKWGLYQEGNGNKP